MTRHFIVGTAGHIDHGKSTLVKALTGVDPDRLPEEKARGMTIEPGFAHFELTDPENESVSFSAGVVDVPGHADFIRNMVAGICGVDVVIFMVAADDGWMPQSEEHLQILAGLGIEHAVVAVTKSDLAEDIAFSIEMIREDVRGTILERAPMVPVCAPTGQGIEELRNALASVLRDHPGPLDVGKPRLPVDRAFSPTGIGTVVTGTLIGGALAGGVEAVVQPAGVIAHVRTVQSHHSRKDHARPGMRTALNLPDIPLAAPGRRNGVARGDVITLERLGGPSATLDVVVAKSSRAIAGQPGFTRPLRHSQRVRVHLGTAALPARLFLAGVKTLDPGGRSIAQLRFDEPVHAFAGDHFILRDGSKRWTVASGRVLDPDARRSTFRRPVQRVYLQARAAAPDDPVAGLTALLARDRAVLREGLLVKSLFADSAVRKAAESLIRSKSAVGEAGWLLEPAWWSERLEQAADAVMAHHRQHPESQGLSLSELRSALGPSLPEPRLVDVLVGCLLQKGFARTGEIIRSGQHLAALPLALEKAGARLRAALAANPFDPPNPAELAPSPVDQRALRFLIETGEVVDLGEKAVVSREAFDQMKDRILSALRDRGQATASELREVIGTTRRVLIPLLERLDRSGVTRRSGDLRSLKPGA